GVAGFILNRFGPRFFRPGRFHTLRPADGVRPGELWHGVFRWDFAIARQDEAAAGDREASFRPAKLQAALRFAGAGLAVRPEGRHAGIFDQGVLRVGRLAVVLQAVAAADAGDRRGALQVAIRVHELERVGG